MTTVPSDAFDYGDPGGVPELREELAAYLRRVRAADVRPEHLIIVGGVAQGLSLALHVLTQQRALRLAVEDPTSHRQVPLLRRAGAHLVPVPVDEQGLDVRRLRGDAVLVTPAHQFPTGVVLSPARRAALMEWAYAGHRIVLEDDYDAEFRFDRDPVGCLQGLAPDRVILSGSVSKALAPGLRLGWVAAPPDLAEAIRRARGELDLGSPVIEQHALAHFLRTGGYDKHLRRMRRSTGGAGTPWSRRWPRSCRRSGSGASRPACTCTWSCPGDGTSRVRCSSPGSSACRPRRWGPCGSCPARRPWWRGSRGCPRTRRPRSYAG
ncbi:PLP-dependent aminotransferase family protein [Nonomuraea thailandensis]